MRLLTGLKALRRPPKRAVVTVGVFDGVHLAHQALIRSAVRLARKRRGTSVVITFDPDPQWVLDPHHASLPLMPIHRRIQLMAALGADLIWIIRFTKAFAQTTPEEFIRRILRGRLRATCVVVGQQFAFGYERQGSLELLQDFGRQSRTQVISIAPIQRDGTLVSSSRIRALIRAGELARAGRLLGRAPELSGEVIHGAGRGRHLGFPTANVKLLSTILPPQGVYRVWVEHGHSRWPGVMNLGTRPTFGPGPLVCEVHLPRVSRPLYGHDVRILLERRLRPERRFATPQALIEQIHRDLQAASLVSMGTV